MVSQEDKILKQFKQNPLVTGTKNQELMIPNFSGVDYSHALTEKDHSTADTAYVPMVLYNTDATPPVASTVPIGTIYIQYTP